MRTITLEEHYATAEFMEGPGRGMKDRLNAIPDKLVELGEKRIAEMDAAGIDMQVLSLTAPGVEQLEAAEAVRMAKASNDHLAEAGAASIRTLRRICEAFARTAGSGTGGGGAGAHREGIRIPGEC